MSLLADHLSNVIGTICYVFCQEGQINIDEEVEFTANILIMKYDLVLQCISLLLVRDLLKRKFLCSLTI
jgi:hypothetical protein